MCVCVCVLADGSAPEYQWAGWLHSTFHLWSELACRHLATKRRTVLVVMCHCDSNFPTDGSPRKVQRLIHDSDRTACSNHWQLSEIRLFQCSCSAMPAEKSSAYGDAGGPRLATAVKDNAQWQPALSRGTWRIALTKRHLWIFGLHGAIKIYLLT